MKQLLISLFCGLLFGLGCPAMGQTPPSFLAGGAVFQNGGSTEFGLQLGGAVNFVKIADSTGQTTAQFYARPVVFVADDVSIDTALATRMEAVSIYGIGEVFFSRFALGTGIGTTVEPQDGENAVVAAYLLEFSWRPIDLARITLGAQYLSVPYRGDVSFVYLAAGVWPGELF